MNFDNLRKNLEMASVYEFQKNYKTWKWLQYMNFDNLRKNLELASVYEFSKFTKKLGNGFSI